MKGIAIRVMRQMRGDKRTLALILFAPILLFTLIYFLLGDSSYVPTIAVDERAIPAQVISALEDQGANVIDLGTLTYDNEEQLLIDDKSIDMVIVRSGTAIDTYILEGTVKSAQAVKALQAAIQSVSQQMFTMESHVVYNEGASSFESMGFVYLSFLTFFFVFVISGMTLVRERTGGTLERLLMTPVKRWQVMCGYTMGYGFFAAIQTVLVVVYVLYVLALPCAGSVGLIFLVMLVNAMVAVLFGAMASIVAASEMQLAQMIPVLVVPQVFFCGLIPLETIPFGLGNIAYITPVYYAAEAIRRVMVEGADFSGVWLHTLALAVFGFVLLTVNTLALKKFRTL
ncbi:MAG: ABC transporter permease [Clostridiales bacterium]|nr:ABC transporter permease [Clostridiales bacterium]